MLARFVIYGFYNVPPMLTFWRVLIMNGCYILCKTFSSSIEIIIWFLFYNLLMWYITVIDLRVLNYPWIPGINPTWSCFITLFMYCWIQIPNTLLRIFAPMFISNNFFLISLYQGYADLMEWVHKHSFLCNFLGEYFQKVSC